MQENMVGAVDTAGNVGRKLEEQTNGKRRMKITTILGNFIFGLLILLIATMAVFVVHSKIKGGPPLVAGHYMFIVLSGSMAPEFDTGSLALVKPSVPEQIQVGDIITFTGFAGSKALTTHRVMEITTTQEGLHQFITKGDANETNDPDPIPAENMIGTVSAAIPYLGYFMSFMQTKQGLLIFIIVPGVLLIAAEAYSIIKNLRGKRIEF